MRWRRPGELDIRAASSLPDEIAFLAGKIPIARLLACAETSARDDTPAHLELIRSGAIGAEEFGRQLALHLGGSFHHELHPCSEARLLMRRQSPASARRLGFFLLRRDRDGSVFALDAESPRLADVLTALRGAPFAGHGVHVVTTEAFAQALRCCDEAGLLDEATHRLTRERPDLSAAGGLGGRRRIALAAGLAGLSALALGAPASAAFVALFAAALFFLAGTMLRASAISGGTLRLPPFVPNGQLPSYSVLVPLYREARMVRPLLARLAAIDYPSDRLDIKLLVEEDDRETRGALAALAMPPGFEIVVVPPSVPRTKPKALNFGLALARGELICIFDAEDLPAPRQLRLAAETFAAYPQIDCLQGRLALYNWPDNWLTRQFALEYAVLFDVLLPFLDRLGMPLPLGGTSNHFRASVLRDAGAWDPFNVTEDADLGFRLARLGRRAATLPISTWEEAPNALSQWIPQRTRWLKRWMQTYLVHMRRPAALLRELGPARLAVFQLLVGGPILSALVYPVFLALLLVQTLSGSLLLGATEPIMVAFHLTAGLTFLSAHLVAMGLGLHALRRRPMRQMLPELATLPAYWLLVSVAGYRAIWQLFRDPFLWEKTEHGQGRSLAAMVPLLAGRMTRSQGQARRAVAAPSAGATRCTSPAHRAAWPASCHREREARR